MKKIKIKGVNEELFYTKLRSGLEVYLIPDKKVKSFYLSYVVKYGSIYKEFRVGGNKKYYTLPNGVAHFLEHLMFKEEDGIESSLKFSKYGSYSNAVTSVNNTHYYVSGATNFKENLETLLKFVNNPYFTEENVNKERGIILEEIKMGNDNPYKEFHVKALENVFYYSKLKESIIGSEDEVKNISLDDINFAYNTFYNPKNMFVVVAGNFNKEEALKIIKANQIKKKSNKFKLKEVKESLNVKKSYDEIFKNVEIPKTSIKLKLSYDLFKYLKEPYKSFYFYLLLDVNFGATSLIKEELVNKGLITGGLYFSISVNKSGIILTVMFESKTPEKVIPIIKKALKNLKVDKEELERKKKCLISNTILYYDKMSNKASAVINDVIDFGRFINNNYDVIKKLNVRGINNIINKLYFKDNISVMVIKPLKKSAK